MWMLNAHMINPPENPGHQSPGEFLWLATVYACCYSSLLELCTIHMTSLGEDNWKFVPGLSWTLPFADITLYPVAKFNFN